MMLPSIYATTNSRRVPRAGQEMLTLPEHQISHLALPGVRDFRLATDFTTYLVILSNGFRLLLAGLFDSRYFPLFFFLCSC